MPPVVELSTARKEQQRPGARKRADRRVTAGSPVVVQLTITRQGSWSDLLLLESEKLLNCEREKVNK